MRNFFTYALICYCTITNYVKAQNDDHPVKIGIGLHAIDYNLNDDYFNDLFEEKGDWNVAPLLSRITVGGALNNAFSLQGAIAMANVDSYKSTDPNKEDFWFDIDLTLQYHLANGKVFKTTSWIDPYLFAGAGLNYLESSAEGFYLFEPKTGLGIDFWVNPFFGFNMQSAYAWQGDEGMSYAHHAAGIVMRLGDGKDSDGDGIADWKDSCPAQAGIALFDGCPDTDNDGIQDAYDDCPTQAGLEIFNGCPDGDGDGVMDKEDRCPTDFGLAQFNGCPDDDKDGIPNIKDDCPKEAGLAKFSGCPDYDGDGIMDKEDRCPRERGPIELQGCPDVDGDGIADIDDKCPDKPGPKSTGGCPVITEEKKQEIVTKINIAARAIQFETASDKIKTSSHPELDNIVNLMNLYPETKWSIEGHTDNQGNDASNLDLSNRRAASVKKYFTDKGIDATRLQSQGFGETVPIDDNKTASGRAQNRRVEIKLVEENQK